MRSRPVFGAVLLAALLALQPGRSAEADAPRPTVLLRVQSLDALIGDFRYLAEQAGKGEEAKQAEGFLKALIDSNGLEGIDTTRPFGLYGHLKPAVPESPFALLLPVANEKAVVALLEKVGFRGEKQADGSYKVEVPGLPQPVSYRFANKYVYATVGHPENIAPAQLPEPAAVLGARDPGLIAATINIDQVPETLRDFVIGESARRAAAFKKQRQPNETDAQQKFRAVLVEEAMTQFKSLLKDGRAVTLRLNVDRQAGEAGWTLDVTAREGSPLAGLIEGLGKSGSVGASVFRHDAAVNGLLHLALPARLRKALEPVIDEGLEKAINQVQDEVQKGLLQTVLKSATPTLKAAELDAGMCISGPDNGLFTLVMGFKVKEGQGIENALREVFKAVPQATDHVTLDVEKVGKVGIHKVVPEHIDAQTKAMLGDNPVYVAIREDAVLVGAGEKGLAALKAALAAGPASGQPLRFEAAMSRLAPLMKNENKGAPAAARKAFPDRTGDKVLITVEGGQALKARLSAQAQVLHFFALLEEMKKKEF